MSSDALVLIGRARGTARSVIETHAARLEDRGVAGAIHVATYDYEPGRELRGQLASIEADRVYAIPTWIAHTADTKQDVPAALRAVPGTVRSCRPLGHRPAITDALLDRASTALSPSEDVSMVLVAFGSGSTPHQRRTATYHAARIEERSAYGEVRSCYLHQNPTVECARYAASNDRIVAVPMFLARSGLTSERIPAKLELDRGGIAYADSLGEHPRVTDAIEAAVNRQRALALDNNDTDSPGARSTRWAPPLLTDGTGSH
jgi:sirohydrochlorin ferrochelatase